AEGDLRRSLTGKGFDRLQTSHPAALRALRRMRRVPIPALRIPRAALHEVRHPAGDPPTGWTDSASYNHDAHRRTLGLPQPYSFPNQRVKRDDSIWIQPPRIE